MDLLQHELPMHSFDLQHKPLVYNSKTALKGLVPAPLMIGIYAATLVLLVLMMCRLISGSDFKRSKQKTF